MNFHIESGYVSVDGKHFDASASLNNPMKQGKVAVDFEWIGAGYFELTIAFLFFEVSLAVYR